MPMYSTKFKLCTPVRCVIVKDLRATVFFYIIVSEWIYTYNLHRHFQRHFNSNKLNILRMWIAIFEWVEMFFILRGWIVDLRAAISDFFTRTIRYFQMLSHYRYKKLTNIYIYKKFTCLLSLNTYDYTH